MSIFKLQHGMAGHKMVLRRSNMRKRMSALGQKQTSRLVRAMSALPPKADIEPRSRDVRFVPKADSCTAANSRAGDDPAGLTTGERTDRGDGRSERDSARAQQGVMLCAAATPAMIGI